MNSSKERFFKVVRMLLLIAAVVLSLILPWLWQNSYDARIENKLTEFSADITTYQMQYKSFAQKLELLAACETRGIELETLAVEDYAEVMSAEQLAKIVREQLEELEESIQFYDFPTEQITADTMNRRVKYVMYTLTDQINISGIDFWEVSYQTDDLEISLKLDSEFYKIYGLQVRAGSIYNDYWKVWGYTENNYSKTAEMSSVPVYDSEIYDIMLSGLLYYWGLSDSIYSLVDFAEDVDYGDTVDDRWVGVIEFFEEVDWDVLVGQTNGKTEGTAANSSENDMDEDYIDEYEKDGKDIFGERSRLNVQLNIFSNNRGFGLLIQK